MGKLARAAWTAAACLIALGGARAHADTIPGAAEQVLTLVNQARAQAGLAPLTMDPQLNQSAQSFSEYMASANFYAHEGPDGSTPLSRMNAAGFPGTGTWGENIAAYYSDAASVMQVWMASPGHRANILNPAFTQIGIGVAVNPNSQWKYYWTQDFGVRAGGAAPGGSAPGGSASGSPIGSLPQTQPLPQAQTPVLTRVSPAQGAAGDRVALSGHNFGGTAGSVSFSGTTAQLLSWGDTQIEVQVPNGAATGAVYVQNAQGTSNGVNFTVVTNTIPAAQPPTTAPQALLVYPAAGNPGNRVTIYGRGFGAIAGQVLFNGVPGQVAYWYDTLISVDIPAGATSGPVVIHASGGDSNPLAFDVNTGDTTATQPQLVYCSPSAGAAGSQVSVLGRNLGDTAGAVSFNGVAANIVNWTSSAIVVIVPPGATSGLVTVQTGGGTSNGVEFTVVPQGQPRTVPPAPAPPPQDSPSGGGGSAGRSSPSGGQGWSGSNTPNSPFGGIGGIGLHPATTPQPAPRPAPSGGVLPMGVSNTGTGAGEEITPLTPPGAGPVAATMAPANAAPGSSITLQGSHFGSAQGWVRIGRTFARVFSWSDTTVVAEVPPGIGIEGRVSVRVVRRDRKYTVPLYLELGLQSQ